MRKMKTIHVPNYPLLKSFSGKIVLFYAFIIGTPSTIKNSQLIEKRLKIN